MEHTPLRIELMIHFYVSPDPYPRCSAPAVKRETEVLLRLGLIVAREQDCFTLEQDCFKATEKGKAWVKMICNTPVPIAATVTYTDPRNNEPVI